MFRVACEGDAAGHLFHRRSAIERVGDEVFLRGEDIFGAEDAAEFGNNVLRERHCDRSMFQPFEAVKKTDRRFDTSKYPLAACAGRFFQGQ